MLSSPLNNPNMSISHLVKWWGWWGGPCRQYRGFVLIHSGWRVSSIGRSSGHRTGEDCRGGIRQNEDRNRSTFCNGWRKPLWCYGTEHNLPNIYQYKLIVILAANREVATHLVHLPNVLLVYFVFCCYQELFSDLNIPKLTINASQRLRVVQRELIQQIQPLVTNRESLFHKCQPISYTLAQNLLLSSYKLHSGFGCWDPVEVSIIH